jgi:hypothetical protein
MQGDGDGNDEARDWRAACGSGTLHRVSDGPRTTHAEAAVEDARDERSRSFRERLDADERIRPSTPGTHCDLTARMDRGLELVDLVPRQWSSSKPGAGMTTKLVRMRASATSRPTSS